MRRLAISILLVAVAAVLAAAIAANVAEAPSSVGTSQVSVSLPKPQAAISSPLRIAGSAVGGWYFEATFPVVVVDWDGRIIGEGHAEATSDWMKPGMVPFIGTIPFVPPSCAPAQDYCRRGSIIFKNDDPSGDPAKSESFEMPVRFQ